MLKKGIKILLAALLGLIVIFILCIVIMYAVVKCYKVTPPVIRQSIYDSLQVVQKDSSVWVLGNNWMRQNRYGLWEMYVEGDAFDRGVAAGKLSEKLVRWQEEVFVSQIEQVVPSPFYREMLLTLIGWFNRKLPKKIKHEYLEEIYGTSLSASAEFDHYGPAYLRILNYHAAHDIGHTMQGYNLVGCSSFSVWDRYTEDSSMITGRNFDFYFGDDFSKHKIIEFVKPDSGYNFCFITWGGMTGVVSGMNDQGLTVTINAGTFKLASHPATPVSLIAREIIQYSASISDAIDIANKYKVFVSESFFISSAADHKTAVIEKNPDTQSVLWPDSSAIVCTNHYQSEAFKLDESNRINRTENATGYRFVRIQQLLNEYGQLNVTEAATILRDKKGLNDRDIGYGNEKALNQLLAHHSVIFMPGKRILWVSTPPNVMGPYIAYDLNKIFSKPDYPRNNDFVDEKALEIPADTFILSTDYKNFLEYKTLTQILKQHTKQEKLLKDKNFISRYKNLNPSYFETWLNLGDYYYSTGQMKMARICYHKVLQTEVNSQSVTRYVIEQLEECNH